MPDKKKAKMAAEPVRLPHIASRLVQAFDQTIVHMEYLAKQMVRAAEEDGEARLMADGVLRDLAMLRTGVHVYDKLMTDEYEARPNPWARP